MLYSEKQQLILGYLPLATAPFSVVGSAFIVYSILLNRKETLLNPYHRIMLGISLLDLLTSTSLIVLGTWAVPVEAQDFVAGARGTWTTCNISGFFLNLLFGSMWYSAFLSLYFWCTIVLEQQRGKKLVKVIEPLGHAVSVLLPVLTGAIGAATTMINPMNILPGWCWFSIYPPNCDDDPILCERGVELPNLQWVGAHVSIGVIFFTVIVCMVSITVKVRTIEKRIQQYAGGQSNRLERTKATGVQSLLYIASFFFCFFPIVMTQTLYSYREKKYYYIFALLTKTVSPLQGAFNFWIYSRKRIQRLARENNTMCSCFYVLAIWHIIVPLGHPAAATATTVANVECGQNCDDEPTETVQKAGSRSQENSSGRQLVVPDNENV